MVGKLGSNCGILRGVVGVVWLMVVLVNGNSFPKKFSSPFSLVEYSTGGLGPMIGASVENVPVVDDVDAGKKAAETVYVGIYFLNVAEVDLAKSSYMGDFYLFFVSERDPYTGSCPPSVQSADCTVSESIGRILVNGLDVSISPITKFRLEGNSTTQYRVRGTFFSPNDARDWPFGAMRLALAIEDPLRNESDLQFRLLPELTHIADTAVVPGLLPRAFNGTRLQVNVSSTVYRREEGSMSFSRFTAAMLVSRPGWPAFVQVVLPPMLIAVVQLVSFSLTPASVSVRVSLFGSGMVAAILFQSNVQSQIPPASGVTFLDKLMAAVYGLLLVNGLVSALILKQLHRQEEFEIFAENKQNRDQLEDDEDEDTGFMALAPSPTPNSRLRSFTIRQDRLLLCQCLPGSKIQTPKAAAYVTHEIAEVVAAILVPIVLVWLVLDYWDVSAGIIVAIDIVVTVIGILLYAFVCSRRPVRLCGIKENYSKSQRRQSADYSAELQAVN